IGGAIRWLVDRSSKNQSIAETESSSGMLLSSGLIAGGAIAGIFIAFLGASEDLTKALDMHEKVGAFGTSDLYPTLIFLGLGAFLFAVGRQWLLKPAAAPKE
ncbi:MAG TPA: peptide transporter, partial [Candidatus Ozemobacteraceae bacterium]|nr:peptide transporter [Candidatus Ozemobacteraceae bacterium]